MSQDDRWDERRNGQSAGILPDPEVRPKAKHRRFPAEYKERILKEAEACTNQGQVGALLRREGLYSSLLSKWRQQQAQHGRTGLAPHPRGRKADPQAQEIARLRRENARLQAKLERAETIIEVQKNSRRCWGCRPNRPRPTDPNEPGRRGVVARDGYCTRLSGVGGTSEQLLPGSTTGRIGLAGRGSGTGSVAPGAQPDGESPGARGAQQRALSGPSAPRGLRDPAG